jgi:hypothetical protein
MPQILVSLFVPKLCTFAERLRPANFILARTRKTHPPTITHPAETCSLRNPPLSATTNASAIGLLINTAIDTIVKIVPVRTPIWRASEICATKAGVILTIDPEVNPNRAAKTTIVALLLDGIYIPRTRIVVTIPIAIKMLKRPMKWSAV